MGSGLSDVYDRMKQNTGKENKRIISELSDYLVGDIFETLCEDLRALEKESLSRNGWRHLDNIRKLVARMEGYEYEYLKKG